MVHTMVVFEEGWSFIRGRKQCKPKHVSSGIVVFNVRWSLIRVVSQEGDYCIGKDSYFSSVCEDCKLSFLSRFRCHSKLAKCSLELATFVPTLFCFRTIW